MNQIRTPAPDRFGLTLLELMVVLVIVAILASIVVPLVSGNLEITMGGVEKGAQQVATETTFRTIQAAMMGAPGKPGYWEHTQEVPATIADLLVQPNHLDFFDPVTQSGWNGPYLTSIGAYYQGNFETPSDFYGNLGDPVILDGWGNPIVIQVDYDGNGTIDDLEGQYIRLVSAGENGILDTPYHDASPTMTPANIAGFTGDDVVLFLRVAQ